MLNDRTVRRSTPIKDLNSEVDSQVHARSCNNNYYYVKCVFELVFRVSTGLFAGMTVLGGR